MAHSENLASDFPILIPIPSHSGLILFFRPQNPSFSFSISFWKSGVPNLARALFRAPDQCFEGYAGAKRAAVVFQTPKKMFSVFSTHQFPSRNLERASEAAQESAPPKQIRNLEVFGHDSLTLLSATSQFVCWAAKILPFLSTAVSMTHSRMKSVFSFPEWFILILLHSQNRAPDFPILILILSFWFHSAHSFSF